MDPERPFQLINLRYPLPELVDTLPITSQVPPVHKTPRHAAPNVVKVSEYAEGIDIIHSLQENSLKLTSSLIYPPTINLIHLFLPRYTKDSTFCATARSSKIGRIFSVQLRSLLNLRVRRLFEEVCHRLGNCRLEVALQLKTFLSQCYCGRPFQSTGSREAYCYQFILFSVFQGSLPLIFYYRHTCTEIFSDALVSAGQTVPLNVTVDVPHYYHPHQQFGKASLSRKGDSVNPSSRPHRMN